MLLFRSLLLVCITLGHGGFWIACFNRVNAIGLPRKVIKIAEKLTVVACLTLPLYFFYWDGRETLLWAWQPIGGTLFDEHFSRIGIGTKIYGGFCLVALAVLTPLFISARRALTSKRHYELASEERFDLTQLASQPIFAKRLSQQLAKIPGNEIGVVEFSHKRLRVPNLPESLVGLSILHLSDLHLTGQLSKEFYEKCIGLVARDSYDLCVLSGDIVDFAEFVDWLPDILGPVVSRHGKYFLLGNHDKRLAEPNQIRAMMQSLGWEDIGQNRFAIKILGQDVEIVGSEVPWFPANPSSEVLPAKSVFGGFELNSSQTQPDFEIAVAHSPDQFSWAVAENSNLLLAGHTHGGQARLPFLGPIVAPSIHGSRYASGVFRKRDTVMHVVRGLGGTHPLRFNCPLEIAKLELVEG